MTSTAKTNNLYFVAWKVFTFAAQNAELEIAKNSNSPWIIFNLSWRSRCHFLVLLVLHPCFLSLSFLYLFSHSFFLSSSYFFRAFFPLITTKINFSFSLSFFLPLRAVYSRDIDFRLSTQIFEEREVDDGGMRRVSTNCENESAAL